MRLLRCGLAFAATALVACGGSDGASGASPDRAADSTALPPDPSTYFPGATWRTATPEQVGILGSVLARVDQRVASRSWRGLDSFIVIRHGYLVHEAHYGASSRDDVHTLQSVSKSVPLSSPALRRTWARSTSTRRGSPLETLNTSRGHWVRIALEQPFNAEPGALWQYNSGGVIALGAAVAEASRTPFNVLARERLFAPLGISGQYWFVSGYDATVHTGGGLNMRAIDLARVGYLVLNRVIIASGNMNQFLFVVPARDLVVVNTGSSNDSFGVTVDFVVRELIPVVSR